jgi:TPR repeat protein
MQSKEGKTMCCKKLTRKVLYSWGIGALLFLQLVAGSSPPETGREEKIASILSPADIRSLHHQCIGGDRDACFTLGLAYLEGDGVRANRRTAYDLARTLCETGNQRACGLQAYIASLKNPPEWESEAELLRRAFSSCEKRSPLGCYTAAQLLRQKSIPEDLRANHPDLPGNTLSLLRKQCARGLRSTDENYIERRMGAITCDLLSAIYFEETLTSKDETLAVAYLRKACSLSSPDACAAMAISYEEGLFYFPKDIRKAAEAYAVACAYRDRNGEECNTLARWYLEGKEGKIEKSLEKAIRYYRYSCRHQSNKADACDLADSLSQKQRSNEIKERIRSIILHGYDDPATALGSMPPGMASGEDAVAVAEYLAKGMRGEKPAAFAVCASCHGPDGDGMPGVGPSLKNLSSTVSRAKETQTPPAALFPKLRDKN